MGTRKEESLLVLLNLLGIFDVINLDISWDILLRWDILEWFDPSGITDFWKQHWDISASFCGLGWRNAPRIHPTYSSICYLIVIWWNLGKQLGVSIYWWHTAQFISWGNYLKLWLTGWKATSQKFCILESNCSKNRENNFKQRALCHFLGQWWRICGMCVQDDMHNVLSDMPAFINILESMPHSCVILGDLENIEWWPDGHGWNFIFKNIWHNT